MVFGLFKKKKKALKDLSVLIVEDSDVIRAEVVSVFQRFGIKTMEAEDGKVALSVLGDLKTRGKDFPDLICSDVNMPNLDGIGLLDEVRRLEGVNDVPFYVLTANREELLRLTAEGLKVNAFFIKPPRPELLERQLQSDFVN